MSAANVVVVDYGLGNLFNIKVAFESVGADVVVSSDAEAIEKADRLILPGVGAFGDGMKGLAERELVGPIREFAKTGRPLMGICLGMQLLLTTSEEFGSHAGLDIVKGSVVRLKEVSGEMNFKVPHIGWSAIFPSAALGSFDKSKLLKGLSSKSYMYFLHSYVANLENPSDVIAVTEYGRDKFCSVFQVGAICGFQSHPERSGEVGLKVFRNFLAL